MRIRYWLLAVCIGLVVAGWLVHDLEVATEDVFVLPAADLAMASAHVNASAGTSRVTLPDGFLLTGHHAVSGRGLVLAYRRHIDRPFAFFGPTETAKFEFLTVSLRNQSAEEAATYDLAATGNGPAFWSEANFGFFTDDGCFGYAKKGTVRVHDGASGEAKVSVDLHIENEPVSRFTLYSCQPFQFTRSFRATVLDLSDFDQRLTAPLTEAANVSE